MKARQFFIEFMAKKVYFPLIRLVYQPACSQISKKALLLCPENSLGQEALRFLTKNNIEFFEGYEAHDLKHVLLNFDTDVKGEIRMQYFELGNGNTSLVVWIVIIFGLLIVPEGFSSYFRAYKAGKQARSISLVQLQDELMAPLKQLREQLHISI